MERREALRTFGGTLATLPFTGCMGLFKPSTGVSFPNHESELDIEGGMAKWTLTGDLVVRSDQQHGDVAVKVDVAVFDRESILDRQQKVIQEVPQNISHRFTVTFLDDPEKLESITRYSISGEVASMK